MIDLHPEQSCQTCGACCTHFRDYEVDQRFDPNFEFLRDRDYLKPPVSVGKFLIGKYTMKTDKNKRCIALKGTVGVSVSCSVYENRPEICRQFEARSKGCEQAILVNITRADSI